MQQKQRNLCFWSAFLVLLWIQCLYFLRVLIPFYEWLRITVLNNVSVDQVGVILNISKCFVFFTCYVMFCIYFSDAPGKKIRCCNLKCSRQWFHMKCVNVLNDSQVDDWYCSTSCKESDSYIYCHCLKKTGMEDRMIQCELASKCFLFQWYHLPCTLASKKIFKVRMLHC